MTPDFAAFERLAKRGNIVPVSKALTADLETPVSAYLKLAARRKYSFLLESVEGGEKIARYTFLGADPFLIVTAAGDRIEIRQKGRTTRRRGNLFEVLPELTSRFRPAGGEGLPPLTAGAVGYIGYDLIRLIEPRVPPFRKSDVKTPDAIFLFFTTLLAFDHVKHQIHAIANVMVDEWKGKLKKGYDDACRRIEAMERALARPARIPKSKAARGPIEVQSNVGKERYCEAVEKAKDYILAGDIFQVVLSQRLEMKPRVEPFQIYRALRMVNPSPYMF
jgi:anthranilate synthase component 1